MVPPLLILLINGLVSWRIVGIQMGRSREKDDKSVGKRDTKRGNMGKKKVNYQLE